MNCYDLTLELIRVMGDIDRMMSRLYDADINERRWMEKEIDTLEARMFEIKNILKAHKL